MHPYTRQEKIDMLVDKKDSEEFEKSLKTRDFDTKAVMDYDEKLKKLSDEELHYEFIQKLHLGEEESHGSNIY